MAVMIPSTYPASTVPGEREIFDRLVKAEGTEGWVVLHSLDIADHCKRICGEIDFMILIPSMGVLCLEVKSHSEIRRSHAGWYYGKNCTSDVRGPFRQASEGMHSIRNYINARVPYFANIPFCSGVCFPYCNFAVNSPEWEPWQCIDLAKFRRAPLPKLLMQMLDCGLQKMESTGMLWIKDAARDFSLTKIQRIVDLVRPNFEMIPSVNARISSLEAEVKHYTDQQFRALDFIENNPRILFSGPAGTGKTLLSIEAAIRRKRKFPDSRVVWLCYNKNLLDWMKNKSALVGTGVEVRSLHAWLRSIAGTVLNQAEVSAEFWNRTLPQSAINFLLETSAADLGNIDFLVVDEAQDLVSELNLDFLDLVIKGGLGSGNWMLFGDFDLQDIYHTGNEVASFDLTSLNGRCPPIAKCELSVNCRNRPRVAYRAQSLVSMNPGYSGILRPDDQVEPVFKVYENIDQQLSLLVDLLAELKRENYRARHVVILSGVKESAASQLAILPQWKSQFSASLVTDAEKFRYGTIHTYKGLEAPVIILTDIKRIAGREDEKLLYTGLTRSIDRLYALVHSQARNDLLELITKAK